MFIIKLVVKEEGFEYDYSKIVSFLKYWNRIHFFPKNVLIVYFFSPLSFCIHTYALDLGTTGFLLISSCDPLTCLSICVSRGSMYFPLAQFQLSLRKYFPIDVTYLLELEHELNMRATTKANFIYFAETRNEGKNLE